MESHEDKGQEETSSQREDEHGSATGGRGTGTGTAQPAISRPAIYPPDWINNPDGTMTVETSRIHHPSESINPNLVIVPVETDRPRRDCSGGGGSGEKANEAGGNKSDQRGKAMGGNGQSGKSSQAKEDRSDKQHEEDRFDSGSRKEENKNRRQSAQQPSLMRTLLLAAAVALVCSIVGAGGVVYFVGAGNKSSSESGSGKGGSKDGASHQGSESGEGAGSGSESSSTGKSGSSDDSSSSKNSEPGTTSSRKGSETARLRQAESAWLIAVRELHEARASEKAARQSAEDPKAVLDFLKTTLLSAGRPGGASLSEAFWTGGKGKDLTLRNALDATEARVADAFAERPLAEASVREMLGLAYLNLGDAAQAVPQYERAFALRKALEGPNRPDTAACRNQLAVAYRLAGRPDDAARLFESNPVSKNQASALSLSGSLLLEQKKAAEAELKLRQALTILQKTQPDDWSTFDTESALGEALVIQKKYAEAEPLLLSGYEGQRLREDTMPDRDKPRVRRALERIVQLYEAWGKPDEAERWRKQLGSTATQPASRISPTT